MGFGTSGSYAVLFLTLLLCAGLVYGVTSNATERAGDDLREERQRSDETRRTGIAVVGADYRGGTLVVNVRNTGGVALSVAGTDLLVDGTYVSDDSRSSVVSGDDGTDLWTPGETLRLRTDLSTPDRVKIVTEHGVAATAPVDAFGLTADVGFTDGSGSLRSYGIADRFASYPGTATGVGPPVSNFASEQVTELPSVNASGDVVVSTTAGDRTVVATGAKSGSTRLSAGRWQGSRPSILYVEAGTKDVVRATGNGTTTVVGANSDVEAQGVAGIADVDGDGADELVYGGNGPSGTSNSVVYVDDDGTVVGTQVGYGTNNGIGLGEPADFDGDGTARVPYVDGGNEIKLVDNNGTTESLTGSGPAVKAPVATGNFDGDEFLEIYFVGTASGKLRVLDNATVDNTIRTVTDDQGNSIVVGTGAGVA